MSYTCRSILDQVDAHAVDTAWQKCVEILTTMASFSLSARNSLQFLQVTHQYIMQNYTRGFYFLAHLIWAVLVALRLTYI